MMIVLSNKYATAVVTGGSAGLGAAFTDMLLKEGVEVWATARDAKRIPQQERLHPCSLDLCDKSSTEAFCKKIQKEVPQLDLLINNAGFGTFAPFETWNDTDIERQLDVLLTGPIRLCHSFYPAMLERKRGCIVNVASLAATFPLPYMSLYNTAKAGLSRFTRSLEIESKETGVTIIDFQPGDYRTRFNEAMERPQTALKGRPARAWEQAEAHLNASPLPQRAAQDLKRTLERNRSGVVTSGDFFQATLAPLLARLGSWRLVRAFLERYYDIA